MEQEIVPPPRRRAPAQQHWPTLAAVSVGGGLGALARYGIGVALPTGPGAFPAATFGINVLGCALIGVLMVLLTEVTVPHRLLRPFLGVGVLGGFTTFSTYAADVLTLVRASAVLLAAGYLLATVVTALGATIMGVAATRAVFRRSARSHSGRGTR